MAFRHFWLAGLLSIVACRSTIRRAEPEPATPENPSRTSPSPAELSPRDSWILQPDKNQYKYRSSTSSAVVMQAPAATLNDSTILTTDFTISLARDTRGASYSVTVNGLSLRPASRASSPAIPDLPAPVSFTGRIETGRLTLNSPSDCNSQVSFVLPIIQRSLILAPLQVRRDQSWTDSTSSAACSGSIPVTLTALRHYRVVGETTNGSRNGLLLERVDRTTSIGEGTDGQHRVQLKTEGTGQSQLLIDPVTGVLLESTGTNTTQVTVTVSGRSQKFIQTSREYITQR